MTDLGVVVRGINECNNDSIETMEKSDKFKALKLHLDHQREYTELME